MPVLFNSVTEFVESVGERITQEKPSTLDTIEAIYTGPSAKALAFLPLPKTPFLPEFPLMYCARSAITKQVALAAEVRVSYVGKLTGTGSAVVITPPEVNQSRHLGSISYTTSVAGAPVTIATDEFTERYTVLTTISYTVRYTALGVTFRYLTNRQPPGHFSGNFVSQAQPFLGTDNIQSFRTAFSAQPFVPATGYLSSQLVFENDLVSVDVQDLGTGWYSVGETFLTQALINTQVLGVQAIR
jgi:hypothetical protein